MSPYFDAWITARMAERGMSRRAIVEQLIAATIDAGVTAMPAARVNEINGHANAIVLTLKSVSLTTRSPDHLRDLATASAAACAIGRLVRGGAN